MYMFWRPHQKSATSERARAPDRSPPPGPPSHSIASLVSRYRSTQTPSSETSSHSLPVTWASMEREARSCGCVNDQTDNELSLGEPLSR